jgi:predicted nucleotide-binding protein
MAKKVTQPEQKRTALIIPLSKFKDILSAQIENGKQIQLKDFKTVPELEEREREFSLWDDYNLEFLKGSFNNPLNEYHHSYENTSFMSGIDDVIRGANPSDPRYRAKHFPSRLNSKIIELESLLKKADLLHSDVENVVIKSQTNFFMNDTVMIIHGHDDDMKRNVQLFINRAGITDIVLHEQLDRGRTIIEKLEEEGSKATYAIALLSPDDVLPDGTMRARQNVILEIGYFLGKLGRERVKLLKKGDVEIPSDLQGILFETYDTSGGWKIKISKELQHFGFAIDLSTIVEKF